jgi:natural product biosynthesis luciferase-like monooxygenase protein
LALQNGAARCCRGVIGLEKGALRGEDVVYLTEALGRLWLAGVDLDWCAVHAPYRPNRVALPGYPFAGETYWVDPARQAVEQAQVPLQNVAEKTDMHTEAEGRIEAYSRPDFAGPYVKPDSDEERIIAAIWEDLLGIHPIGLSDNFFELGGHSLLTIQLISRVRDVFGVDLPLRLFLQAPTVAGLANSLYEQLIVETPQEELIELLAEVTEAGENESAPGVSIAEEAPLRVMIHQEPDGRGTALRRSEQKLAFSVFFFAGDEAVGGSSKYDFVLKTSKFADENGFEAVWVPDRHFHRFGGLYPNPAVLGAALAMTTRNLQIRAGSVVLPARHPISVAEEWSVVDNLSRGRVGIAIASGFHPLDFVFRPENYPARKSMVLSGIKTIRQLWSGKAVEVIDGAGNKVRIEIFPKPIQSDLPLWLTSGGNPETFKAAGEIGAKVLTAMVSQDFSELAERTNLYWDSFNKYHNKGGGVTVMLHTFIGEDEDTVYSKIRRPFLDYLRSHTELAHSFLVGTGFEKIIRTLAEDDINSLLESAFERFHTSRSLIGTKEKCTRVINDLRHIGITEIACLVDIGVEVEEALDSLALVKKLF